MPVPFYDNWPIEPEDGWVDIERIYCFDWDAFDATLLNRLREVFNELPSSAKHDANDCHWWYSDREDLENGYLTAGMEPPGLQVFGTLPLASWQRWNGEFLKRTDAFPVRNLRPS